MLAISQSLGISGPRNTDTPTTTWLGVLGRQSWSWTLFDLLRAAVWELPELPLTSPKSSTALWRERYGCCLFSVSLFLPPSRCFSFLSPSSFCLTRAWRSAALPQHCWGAATCGAGGGCALCPGRSYQVLEQLITAAFVTCFPRWWSCEHQSQNLRYLSAHFVSFCSYIFFLPKFGLASRTTLDYLTCFSEEEYLSPFNTIQRLSL